MFKFTYVMDVKYFLKLATYSTRLNWFAMSSRIWILDNHYLLFLSTSQKTNKITSCLREDYINDTLRIDCYAIKLLLIWMISLKIVSTTLKMW